MSSQSQQQQTQNPSPTKLLSLDDISHCFSLSLSDAASSLGVCTSVLKKICHDNGLDRWPYRKFLSGRSIEEIKKDAAREKSRELAELLKIGRQSGYQHENKEVSRLHNASSPNNLHQQGNKNTQLGQPQNLLSASLTKGIKDEFKYGFPSDGLSAVSNRWWGSAGSDDGYKGSSGDGTETDEEASKKKHEEMEEGGGASPIIENKEKPENGKDESNIDLQGSGLLTAVRKRAMEEGREALRLGVYRNYGTKKLGKRERALLIQIFGSSLPKGWLYGSS